MTQLAWTLGPTEMIVVGVVAVLLFGKRLPEVGRDLGKGLLQFKKSLGGAGKEIAEAKDATREVTNAVMDLDSVPEPDYGDENDYGDEEDYGDPDGDAMAYPDDTEDSKVAEDTDISDVAGDAEASAAAEPEDRNKGAEEKTA